MTGTIQDDMRETDALRRRFLPDAVRVLFIGESPPAGGAFFYRANSALYLATKDAFEAAVPESADGESFLDRFCRLGCYLDDLCLEPVNHLEFHDPRRLRARLDGEELLAERMRFYAPQQIVVAMIVIGENVTRAATRAELDRVPRCVLPFPGRRAHRDRYVGELAKLLVRLRAMNILRDAAAVE